MTDKTDNPTKGILMIVMAMFIFACQDTVTKQLAQTYDAPQILWVRFLFFGVFAVILSSWNQPLKQVVKAHRPWLQIVRSLLIVLEISAFVLAIRVLSLAETHALFASFPLMVTAMSALILRERVGIRRWAAVLVGFSGVLIILRPGFGVFQLESLIALSAALMFSIYHVLTRIVSRNDSSNTSMLYMAVIGAAIMTCIGPLYWIEPTPQAWRLLALLSLTGAVGHLLLIKALECAPASVLQPFNFTLLVWATLMGYIVFNNLPDMWTLIGGAVVVASGLYTIYRERQRNVPEVPPEIRVKP
ncbi:MAG: EamA family transporter [Rhodospirillaceae bacterium]|jgi:drug/metabolite transporter (DMT)-like permease|uniref:DMT family transporter n=1 Tax=unclassified Hwanghaeella TaxID=2605944 RepID=UPI000C45DD5E|nr:EamA family transporter [Rhodospirillales bacterium]MAX47557.1 EamA family transporter [Rhodospirillaceae bacterium]|tara:strand:+ start:41793 stop:42698 length:906 start_codon:yes stop_codon:yes gene_type:complete